MPIKQMVKRSEVEVARRRRTCKFTGAAIPAGTLCLVVYEGQRDRSCYSSKTALQMILKARERLDELCDKLNGVIQSERKTG